MTFRIIVSTPAAVELQEAALWLEEKRPGYGELLLEEYDSALIHLARYPYGQSKHAGGYHQLKIGRFKYYLIYEIISDIIYIYKIIHASQHPRKKRKPR